ncbi:MAG: response regulator [Planctomycetota bacterium]
MTGKKILLVDDDVDFVEANRAALRERGYEVSVAYSGGECAEKIRLERPDLIILDVMMETQTEGFNLSRDLRNREQTKTIPILLLTSVNDTVPFRFGPDKTWLPVDAFLEKPVRLPQLLEEVERLLGVRSSRGV